MKRATLTVMMSLLAGLGVAWARQVPHEGVPPIPIERKAVVPDSQLRASATCLLQLPELTIVHEPASGIIQIASMGMVLSYGGGWDHRQVKPYLFHLRHQSWKAAFWKVNTSRREVALVWGGLFGGIGPSGKSEVMKEIQGARIGVAVDVAGGSDTCPPDRFFIRIPQAQLYVHTATKLVRLAAAGATLSIGDDWEICQLQPFLYHIRLKTWRGFHWKLNTSRAGVWRTSGSFCQLGGTDSALDVQVRNVTVEDSLARPRTTFTSSEQDRLRRIARLIASGAPWAAVARECDEFAKISPGTDRHAAVAVIATGTAEPGGRMTEKDISQEIAKAKERLRETKEARQEVAVAFENAAQRQAQLFETLSAVLKRMQEADEALVRNLK